MNTDKTKAASRGAGQGNAVFVFIGVHRRLSAAGFMELAGGSISG
jgi:hypothetical protein